MEKKNKERKEKEPADGIVIVRFFQILAFSLPVALMLLVLTGKAQPMVNSQPPSQALIATMYVVVSVAIFVVSALSGWYLNRREIKENNEKIREFEEEYNL